VSRTWSRHASIPDWTNQARVVSAPEDIVINRDRSDDDLERGMGIKEKSDGSTAVLGDGDDEGVLGEKGVGEKEGEGEAEEGEEGSSDDGTKLGQSQELEYLPQQGSGEFPKEKNYRQQAPQEDYRKQVPPDGDDAVMEWKEGRQRVVERKRGAGDDMGFLFSLLVFFRCF
jgi:hypothetical protein